MATPLVLAQMNGDLAYTNSGAGGTADGFGALRYRSGHTGGVSAALVESSGVNEVTNAHAVTATSGWTPQTGHTISREITLPAAAPTHYAWPQGVNTCFKNTNTGTNQPIVSTSLVTAAAGLYWMGMWFYIPSTWTASGSIQLALSNFTGGSGTTTMTVNMALRDQWQWVKAASGYTVDVGDLSGTMTMSNTAACVNGETFYWTGAQFGLQSYGPTTPIPQIASGTTVLPGYSFVGSAHVSDSVRAATKIEIPTTLPASVALRYSEDGTTWTFAYVTTLTGTNVGTRGKLSHNGTSLVLESDRTTLYGPVYAFSDTLTTEEQTTLSSTTTWTFNMILSTPAATSGSVIRLGSSHTGPLRLGRS